VFGIVLLGLLAVALPLLVGRYLWRLPEAPACPECRAVTLAAASRAGWVPLSRVVPVTVRECSRCGWRGRMRWRWARSEVLSRRP